MGTVRHGRALFTCGCWLLIMACGSQDPGNSEEMGEAQREGRPDVDSESQSPGKPYGSPLVGDPQAVTSVDEAMAGVFIQPFVDCREPLDGRPGEGPEGQVCTNVAISGATESGRYFPDYGSCDVVRTQRPFWERPPAGEPDPQDPRLQDAEYMAELAWAKAQVEASACTCCHDSRAADGRVGQWDIAAEPIWITTLSNTGLALFAGFADSSVFGAYPPETNNGFSRDQTGIPTDDPQRMSAFLRQEMEYRGISEDQARTVPPFGGPIYAASVAAPEECEPGQGVSMDGTIRWTGGPARYVYVLQEGSANPGVPPNLDLPDGTLWRLDVRADAPALASGITYGAEPEGSLQRMPAAAPADLEPGERYQLVALFDVGLPITNCVFTFGEVSEPQGPAPSEARDESASEGEPELEEEPTQSPEPEAGSGSEPGDGEACSPGAGFGASCTSDAECGCPEASYCAIMPGQAVGNCTATGCVDDPSVCPDDWSCFDISLFAPGQPAICLAP